MAQLMFDQATFLRTVSAAAADLVRPYDTVTMLENLSERVSEVLALTGSGVSLESDGRLAFITALDEQIARVEQVQERTQEGPCVDCFRGGNPVVVPDLEAEGARWAQYADAALQAGLRATAGVPMTLEGRSIGALNLYSSEPREWPDEDVAAAQVLADLATAFLVNASKLRQQEELAAQLAGALESRVLIEQAKGVVSASAHVSVDEAFRRMRSWARNHNLPLPSVAQDVVEGSLRL
jgi:GAF domain-containing protein